MTETDLRTLTDDYLDFCEHRRGLRPLTLRSYRFTLTDWADWCDAKHLTLEAASPDDVEDFGWRPKKRDGQRPSRATARRDMVAVKRFIEWCVARRGVDSVAHMEIVTPPTADSSPNPIADEEWRAIWKSPLGLDDRLWLGDAYFLGRRRYEIVTTRPSDIDVDDATMRFERKRGKIREIEYRAVTEIVARTLPWLTEGWEEWADYLEWSAQTRAGEPHLCVYSTAGDPNLDGNRLNKRLNRICEREGLKPVNPHRLRHSAITNFFRAGLPESVIMSIAGHESFNTTKGYMSVSGYLQRHLDQMD